MQKTTGSRAISIDGGPYNWDDVEKRANQLGFKMLSRYFQYLISQDLNPKKKINGAVLVISLLLVLVVILQVISLFILR